MKTPTPPPSKLFIRSEVLAVIETLALVDAPPKQDKVKQIKRLRQIDDPTTVRSILLKELQRCTQARQRHVISEILMEIGTIETLQEPLWALIRNPEVTDEVKDAANLILRHLGDETDPDAYLEFLEDPQGLISRETERMLEVSAGNPEALIDFIDFIFSLPVEEQCNLLTSLQADYDPEYLVNIYIPTFWAEPPQPVRELIVKNIGKTLSKRAALFLDDVATYFDHDPEWLKLMERSVKELRLAGLYREEDFPALRESLKATPHPVVQNSSLFQCFATLPDGIGNQGIVVSRRQTNGDIAMMSVAINDLHGVIDCFGFYQLSEADFNKIAEKFHEESSKISVPPAYCLQELEAAEALNRENRFRLPYEYACWKVLLSDIPPEPVDTVEACRLWANPQWATESANLYHHPDFSTWFLEDGDHPLVDAVLASVREQLRQPDQTPEGFLAQMEDHAQRLVAELMATEWREVLIYRLADAAYLLHCQETQTFRSLAATEVLKLVSCQEDPALLRLGFIRQYGRRCVEEELLRQKQQPETPATALPWIEHVLTTWEME